MLKLALEEEERFGGLLLEVGGGQRHAGVCPREGPAAGACRRARPSLSERPHRTRRGAPDPFTPSPSGSTFPGRRRRPDLVSLAHWLRELEPAAAAHGGILSRCADTARALLASPREVGVLRGDLHHDNVLDFGAWLACDRPQAPVGRARLRLRQHLHEPRPDLLYAAASVRVLAFARDARTLSTRRPSRSTTSKRQPRVSTASPTAGKCCSSPMTSPATVS